MTWKNNYIHIKLWDVINHPCLTSTLWIGRGWVIEIHKNNRSDYLSIPYTLLTTFKSSWLQPIWIKYLIHGDRTLFLSGAIFDANSREAQSAFSYEIMNVNYDSTNVVRLDVNSQTTQINDSFSVATTCRYMDWCLSGTTNKNSYFKKHGAYFSPNHLHSLIDIILTIPFTMCPSFCLHWMIWNYVWFVLEIFTTKMNDVFVQLRGISGLN